VIVPADLASLAGFAESLKALIDKQRGDGPSPRARAGAPPAG
jgi:hypothetical protein